MNDDLQAWMDRTEAATKHLEPDEAAQTAALQTFETELSDREQMTLLREIVETRSSELCRAYESVISLTYGFRRKNQELVRTPCITFVVKKKWSSGSNESPDQRLPRHLFAYWTLGDRRKLCAVPTDVDEAADYAEMEPQATRGGVEVDPGNGRSVPTGTITCAIERSHQPGKTFVLSARHVFTVPNAARATGLPVRQRGNGVEFARTISTAGALAAAPAVSLDAQVAEVTELDVLWDTLGHVRLASHGRSDEELDSTLRRLERYWIQAPSGPIEVTFDGWQLASLRRDGIGDVLHRRLIRSEFVGARTRGGDSGAPVTTTQNGGILLGMHIGAHGTLPIAYAIPSVDLMNSGRYVPPGHGEEWRLLQPEALETHPAAPAPQPGAPEGPGPGAVPGPAGDGGDLSRMLPPLTVDHRFQNSDTWRLTDAGIRINDRPPEITQGEPVTVERVWLSFGGDISAWADHYDVPIELIVATICTESSGKPLAVREEPGYISDEATPAKVSVGLMQTLIATARGSLRREGIAPETVNRVWLSNGRNSIRAGTAYIREQVRDTGFDPPKVACAYNAGSVRHNASPQNRWKMRQFPIDSSEHADRFVRWFNDCFRFFAANNLTPVPSFRDLLRRR